MAIDTGNFRIRTVSLPADYQAMAELTNVFGKELSRPLISAKHLQAEDARIPVTDDVHFDDDGLLIGFCRKRLVAEHVSGRVIGCAAGWRAPWATPGFVSSMLVTDPEFRLQGVGKQLLNQLQEWASEIGARYIQTEVPDRLEFSRAFAERNGFELVRQMWQSILDLETFRPDRFEEVVQDLNAQGVTFASWRELEQETDFNRLYDLACATAVDNPGGDEIDYNDFTDALTVFPDCTMFALVGGEPVGMTLLTDRESPGEVYNEYTGVAKHHRGRKLALALKVLSLAAARQMGSRVVRTDNDSLNKPMLAVNQSLGFTPVPGGHYVMQKRLLLSDETQNE